MKKWCHYETPHREKCYALRRFLMSEGILYRSSHDRGDDVWRVAILTENDKQIKTINTWLNTH